jgi:hypothetical protein
MLNRDLEVCAICRLPYIPDQGIAERIAQGDIELPRQFHTLAGRKREYARRRMLDRVNNRALLLKYIEDNRKEGSRLHDLMAVVPALSRQQIQVLLQNFAVEGRVHLVGRTRAGRWFPGPAGNGETIPSES